MADMEREIVLATAFQDFLIDIIFAPDFGRQGGPLEQRIAAIGRVQAKARCNRVGCPVCNAENLSGNRFSPKGVVSGRYQRFLRRVSLGTTTQRVIARGCRSIPTAELS